MAQAISMVHLADPRTMITEECAPFMEGLSVLGARVLVAVYVPPESTKGGIILTTNIRTESNYQGKVGLILALGPIAFQDDPTHRFGSHTPKVGDWVVFNVGDTFGLELGKRRARNIEDVDVHMIITDPDSIR